MFEKLLEKILERILGKYIDGISKDQMNVGIWSGNVDIGNLRLKQRILTELNLPFELKFGMIESLKMKIPWKNLSDSSIQVNIQGVYLLIVPKSQSTWAELDNDVIENRQAYFLNYAKTMVDTITEKLKLQGKEADKGYFGKLVERIIDNLTISVKDIHIRLESVNEPIENLSFGVTLDGLHIQTCDENWKPMFVDSNDDSKKQTIFKSLEIRSFYIYWNAEEDVFLSQVCKDTPEYFRMMKALIFSERSANSQEIQRMVYLFNFSTVAHLRQTKLTRETVAAGTPEYDVEIQLDACNFNLSQIQMKQTSKIINVVSDFGHFLDDKEARIRTYRYRPFRRIITCTDASQRSECIRGWWRYAYRATRTIQRPETAKLRWFYISPRRRREMKETTVGLVNKMLFAKEGEPTDILNTNELLTWQNMIGIFDKEQIQAWIDENLKTQKLQEQIQKEQSKKTGFMGLWGKNKEVNEDDERKLKELLDNIVSQTDTSIELPDSYAKFKIRFIQKRFNISLTKRDLVESVKEEVFLQTKDTQVDFYIKKVGFRLLSSLKGIKLAYRRKDMVDRLTYDEELFFCDKAGESFFTLAIEDKPSELQGLDKKIDLSLGSVNFIYNARMIQSMIDIFKFEISEEVTDRIRLNAKKKIREAKDIGENAMRDFLKDQPKFMLNVRMKTPQIILPIDANQLQNSACWIFFPGDLKIQADTFSLGDSHEMYDNFAIALTDIQFVHCRKVQYALSKNVTIEQIRSNAVEDFTYIFRDFNIEVGIKVMKKVFVDLNLKEARTIVSARLNALNMNLTPPLINDLKQIGSIFVSMEGSAKRREKKAIISGATKSNYLDVRDETGVNLYFAVLSKHKIYFFENPKDDEKAVIAIDLEELPTLNFAKTENLLRYKQADREIQIIFDGEPMFNSWRKAVEGVQQRINKRLEVEGFVQFDQDGRATHLPSLPKIEEEVAKELSDAVINIQVDFIFENLQVKIATPRQAYVLDTESLTLALTQSETTLRCKVELQKFSLFCQEGSKTQYIFTSFYNKSLASRILKDSYVQKQEQLLIIKYEQATAGEDTECKRIKILFGSLFVDFEPTQINTIMGFLLAPAETTELSPSLDDTTSSESLSLKLEDQTELGPKVLEIYDPSPKKFNDPKEAKLEIDLSLEIQAINLLLINGIRQNPLMNVICQDSSAKLLMKKGWMDFQAEFFELRATDLTNFPNTLATRSIERIRPSKFLGKFNEELTKPLIVVHFMSKDPQVYNIGTDFVTSWLDVKVDNVLAAACVQPLLRVINFITEQILPSLSGQLDFEVSVQTNAVIATNISEKSPGVIKARRDEGEHSPHRATETAYMAQRKAYIAVNRPFWMKMNVLVVNTKIKMPINDNSKIFAMIERVTVTNNRFLNADRIYRAPNPTPSSDTMTGVWNDDYVVSVEGMSLALMQVGKGDQRLTSSVNLLVKVQLPLFEPEYDLLFKPARISNYQNKHLQTRIQDNSVKNIKPSQILYDNAMVVRTHLTPFILLIGNFEYLSIMKALDSCVTYNDGLDEVFVKDFKQLEQTKKAGAMVVFCKIERIALVSLDNANGNAVTSKVFLNDFNFVMVSHPTGESAMSLKIQDLRGYHLLKYGDQYHEKGFIGELWVTKVHEPKDPKELTELFLRDIYAKELEKKATINDATTPLNIELTMETTTEQKSIFIKVLKLTVLLQTDVLLDLLGIIKYRDLESSVEMVRKATVTAQPEKKAPPQKTLPMVVNVELAENSFLLPSAESEVILVLRSNILVTYTNNPDAPEAQVLNKEMFESTIQAISRREIEMPEPEPTPQQRQSVVRFEPQALTQSQAPLATPKERMSVVVKLKDCELFMIKFVDFFREQSALSSKRELILPFTTELRMDQHGFKRVREAEHLDFDEVTVNKVSLTISNEIEIKYTVLDVELLLGIANYQLLLMNKGEVAQKAVEAAESVEEDHLATTSLPLSYTYLALRVEELKMTLINDNQNIFAPVLIFKLKKFGLYADMELMMKVALNFGFEGYYFNSEIFHWEPFVEPTSLLLEYQTQYTEGGVLGKTIQLSNFGNDEKFNVNLSIAFLTKIKFLTDTWEAMKLKNEEEAERVKNVKLENYLKSIQAQTIQEALAQGSEKQGSHTSYISPIRITNTTGYPILVKYYKKVINIREGNPVLKSMDEKFVELAAGESKPFSTDESIEDYQDVSDRLQTNLSYKFISIQPRHPEFTINRIDNVNVIINHSKKINLKGKEKNLSDYKIIYSSRTHRDIKEILISSPMMFVNSLKETMRIVIRHPFGDRPFTVAPGDKVYIPFDLVAYLFDIYIGGKKMVFKGKFESFYLKQTGHFLVLNSEDRSLNIVLKVYQEVKFRYLAKLVAIPAVSFKNNLPMPISLTLANHSNQTKKIDLDKENRVEFSDFDIGTCLKMSITVPGFKPSDLITLIEMNKERGEYRFTYPKSIRLVDIQGKDTFINLVRVRDGYSHFFYSIFCNVVMINETPFPVICHASEKYKMPKTQVGGQSNLENVPQFDNKIALIGGIRTFANLSLGDDPKYVATQYSNTISTQGITSGVFQVPIKARDPGAPEMILELGYTMRLFYLAQNDVTASKVILLTPKTILYNNSNSEIKIDSDDFGVNELLPEQKIPIYVYRRTQKNQKLITFSVVFKGETFRTFVPLDLTKVGTAIFLLGNETRSAFRVFKVEITLQSDYIFVTFADRTGHKDFSVVNNTEFDLAFEQVDEKDKFNFFARSGETIEFGLVNPYGVKAVEIAVVSRDSKEQVGGFAVKLHKLTRELHQFKTVRRFNLFSNLELKDDTRQLSIQTAPLDATLDDERKRKKKDMQAVRTILGNTKSDFTNIHIKIKEFGLSVIAKYHNQVTEMFYVYLSELRLIAILAEEKKEIQFVIKYINVDSNYSTNCKYPVLLTVSRSKESLSNPDEAANFFNFHVIMNNSSNENLLNIDLFEFEILPLTFTAEFSLINVILALKKQVDKIFASKSTSDYLFKYFKDPAAELTQSIATNRDSLEWQLIQFGTSNRWIYCGEFKMSVLKILMTFNMSSYSSGDNAEGTKNSNVDLLIETFGVTFLNIDESPLSFSGLKLESVFESMDAFVNIIVNHLKDQKNTNIAKLVGSLDIIGNPVSLFSNLSEGVVEFFEKPVSGFVKGPVEGFYGIAEGSSSLIKNTAAGTFNTISKITSSLASGLTALSMDKEYLNKRNNYRSKKPQNALQGMGRGAVSIGKGLLSGITGVVVQPIKEVKSSGATGIFFGVFKGVSGLITKPLGGLMDATSQTAEGIKKSVQSKDDRANELKIRVPRVFYSSLQYFKVYNRDDSETMKILKTLDNNKYENDTFFDSIEVTVQENSQKHFIVLTNENFLILSANKAQVVFKIEIRDISRMRYIDENNLNIDYYVNGEKRSLQLFNERDNIFKIINTVNYCKYINHVDSA